MHVLGEIQNGTLAKNTRYEKHELVTATMFCIKGSICGSWSDNDNLTYAGAGARAGM